jgi:hypothetical protein
MRQSKIQNQNPKSQGLAAKSTKNAKVAGSTGRRVARVQPFLVRLHRRGYNPGTLHGESMTTVSAATYNELVALSEQTWKVTDQTLYRLCRENPGHADRSAVCAKLWIIGRTFATGIERKVKTDGTQGSSMSQVADHFCKHSTEIDSWFAELAGIAEPLDATKCKSIVSIHGRMVGLLCPITRRNQSTRSFVSKYMHFHNPAVPIFDSLAFGVLRGLARWNHSMALFEMPTEKDESYGWYVMRFLALYKQLEAAGLMPSVRHLDYYLLSLVSNSSESAEPEATSP